MASRYAVAVLVPAAFMTGCSSLCGSWIEDARRQYQKTIQEVKADMAILDSDNDGLEAFSPADAKYMRATRADMERSP